MAVLPGPPAGRLRRPRSPVATMHPRLHLMRASLSAVAVIGSTIGGAAVGAFLAMWLAASIDPTMGGWIGVFFVALPIGLVAGGAIGLYGSLWLTGRRRMNS